MPDPVPLPPSTAAPGRRLSDRDVRVGCVLTAVAVLSVLALVPPTWRWPGVNDCLAILLQVGLGLAAATGLERLFQRHAIVAGIVVAAIVVTAARVVPGDVPLVADVLTWSPFIMLLTLGALAAIPRALHEAAAIDRAGPWFELGNLTMPLVAPVLLGGIVFRVIDTFTAPRPFPFVLLAYGVLAAGIALGEIAARVRRGAWR